MNFFKKTFIDARSNGSTSPLSSVLTAGPFVYVSGQRPVDPDTGVIPEGIEAQTAQCIRNLEYQLSLAGASLKDLVRTHVYIVDQNDFTAMNKVYREMIPEPYPTRTTAGVQLRNILVEIECEAVLPNYSL